MSRPAGARTRLVPALFAGLFDDAALFPPGNAPMPDAIDAHARYRDSWYAAAVGPFVCPAARLGELDAATGGDAPALSLILRDAHEPIASHRRVAAVECPPGLRDDVTRVRDTWRARPDSPPVYAELGWDDLPHAIDALPDGVRLKLRTGGTVADAFPGEDRLAGAILAATGAAVAFKCTAGLHHAVRHRDPVTGFEHHGFLNVLLATHTAARTGEQAATAAVLAEHDPGTLAGAARELTEPAAAAVRHQFASFGTCSITEPLDDLRTLALVSAP